MAKAASWGRTSARYVPGRAFTTLSASSAHHGERPCVGRTKNDGQAQRDDATDWSPSPAPSPDRAPTPPPRPCSRAHAQRRQRAAQTRPLAARQVHESRGDQTASEHSSERSTRPTRGLGLASDPIEASCPLLEHARARVQMVVDGSTDETRPEPLERGAGVRPLDERSTERLAERVPLPAEAALEIAMRIEVVRR